MEDARKRQCESHDAIGWATEWLTRQFGLAVSLLAAFAENDNRVEVEVTTEHRTL